MNTGTAVFFIVLLLVVSFAGLGYLINENGDINTELARLQQENETLRTENGQLQNQVTALGRTLEETQVQLERAMQELSTLTQTCQQPAPQETPVGLQDLLSALPWLLVTAGGVTRITSLRFRRNCRSRSRKPGKVSLELERSQMEEFIRWQRSRKQE